MAVPTLQRSSVPPEELAPAVGPCLLLPSDLAAFGRLGISPVLLAQARVQQVTDEEARGKFGIKISPTTAMTANEFASLLGARRTGTGLWQAQRSVSRDQDAPEFPEPNEKVQVKPVALWTVPTPEDCARYQVQSGPRANFPCR